MYAIYNHLEDVILTVDSEAKAKSIVEEKNDYHGYTNTSSAFYYESH